MKTDLTPSGNPYNLKTAAPTKNGKALLPAGEKVPGGFRPDGKDYRVDLSEAAKTPASAPSSNISTLTSPPLPSTPSTPSIELPKFESSPKEIAKAEIKSEAKDEAVKKAKEAVKAEEKITKKGSIKKPAIVFVTGWQMMFSPSKSEGSYAGLERMAETVEGARLYGWDQKDEILKHIENTHPDQPVVLVGHSLGGDTAVEVANQLDSLESKFRKVDLLVTLDALGFNNDIIPQNVKEHLNVFGESSWFLNDGPHVARRHEMTEVKNILSPLDHTELDDAKDIQYEIVSAIEKSVGKKLINDGQTGPKANISKS